VAQPVLAVRVAHTCFIWNATVYPERLREGRDTRFSAVRRVTLYRLRVQNPGRRYNAAMTLGEITYQWQAPPTPQQLGTLPSPSAC